MNGVFKMFGDLSGSQAGALAALLIGFQPEQPPIIHPPVFLHTYREFRTEGESR